MALVSIDIYVDRLDDVLAIFDRIEVYRSTSGELGPYSEVTAAAASSAILDGTVTGTFDLNGLTLDLNLDLVAASPITFVGDGLSLQQVIDQINAVVPGLASEVPTDTDLLRLTSPSVGTGSAIEVAAGAAATALGLDTAKVNGKAARIPLVSPTSNYNFLDLDGDQSYFYKTRYSSSLSGTVSTFSDPRQGSADTVVPSAQLSLAKVTLVTGDGKPVSGRCIVFHPQSVHQVSGETQWLLPGYDGRVVRSTNEQGFAQAPLIRGGRYRVHFEGTSYMREFTVPDLAEFDLLPILGTLPDPFDIAQIPPRPIKVTI